MSTTIPEGHSVRDRLHEPNRSLAERYAWFVIGELSWPRLIAYELLTTMLGPMPGALGLALRKVFYPALFGSVGRDVSFGRDLVLRHPSRIHLGDRVHLDDGCLVDARGAGAEGVILGDGVLVGRNAHVQAKIGPIRVGKDTVIGQDSLVISQGGIAIGDGVSIAGHCKISGGLFRIPREGGPPEHYTNGPIRIGPRCMLASGAIVLDGVALGEGVYVGAGAVVSSDLPAFAIAAARPPLVLGREDERPADGGRRDEVVTGSDGRRGEAGPADAAAAAPAPDRSATGPASSDHSAARPASSDRSAADAAHPATVAAVLSAVEEVNLQLPADQRVPLTPDARLWGEGAALDSLGLVNLLVLVEERVEATHGAPLSLGDAAQHMDDGPSPFATVGSLARYVDALQGR